MFESHIDLDEDIHISDFEEIMEKIEPILHKYDIHHFTLQPEFNVNDNKEVIHK
jgi:cobalt-zinc-cadmium efflux system protein